MAERIPSQAGAATPCESGADIPSLHIASGEDMLEAAGRDDRLDAILTRGDIRDQQAERRDRRADRRPHPTGDDQARIDRDWAGRDRDAAAIDRSDLIVLLHARHDAGR